MSWTLPGRPWVDFEWLPEILYSWIFGRWGMAGLWALKAALLSAAGLAFLKLLDAKGAPKPVWPGAFLLWAAAIAHQSDLRPDAISLLAFTAQLAYLENGGALRQGAPVFPPLDAELIGFAAFYALWADCHAGLALGLLALGLHFFWHALLREKEMARRSGLRLAAGLLGSACGPYGLALWRVIIQHAGASAGLRQTVLEWRSPPLARPFWLLAALAASVAARRFFAKTPGRKGGSREGIDLSLMILLGLLTAESRRLEPYFAVAALAALGAWLAEDAALLSWARRPFVFPALLAGFLAFAAATTRSPWLSGRSAKPFDPVFVCRRTAEWLVRNETELGRLPAFHLWGWGGYLGWRLPGFKIFADGRYIFHELNLETSEAARSPEAWGRFLDRWRPQLALLPNLPLSFRGGPFYRAFMPRKDWALVYWDSKALVFVRRGAVTKPWLRRHEYRELRDDPRRHAGEIAQAYSAIPFSLK